MTDFALRALADRANAYDQRAARSLIDAEHHAAIASDALADARECQAGAKACREAIIRLQTAPAA